MGTEGGVQALDVGGVDDRAGGRRRQHRLDAGQGTANDPARDADDVPPGRLLDDLGELEARRAGPAADDRAARSRIGWRKTFRKAVT